MYAPEPCTEEMLGEYFFNLNKERDGQFLQPANVQKCFLIWESIILMY